MHAAVFGHAALWPPGTPWQAAVTAAIPENFQVSTNTA